MTANSSNDPLLSAVENVGIDPDEVRRILWAVIAPLTRDDLSEVLGKFARVLTVAEDRWPGVLAALGEFAKPAELNIAAWPAVASKLRPIVDRLKYPITPLDARHFEKSGGSGHRQRNALYSAILALPAYPAPLALPVKERLYCESCYLLMAHVFVAHFKVLSFAAEAKLPGTNLVKGDTSLEAYEAYSDKKQWRALTISPKNCCMALRLFFAGEPWAQAVVPAYPLSERPVQFARYGGLAFDELLIENGESKTRLEELQGYLLRYLAQAYGFKEHRHGHGKNTSSPGTSSKKAGASEAKVEAAFRHDICPGEDEAENDETDEERISGAVHSDRGGATSKSGSGRQANRKPGRANKPRKGAGNAAGAGSDQAISKSKFFPFATDRPSPSVLAVVDIDGRRRAKAILAELKTMVGFAKPADGHDPAEAALKTEVELLLFLLVMLWSNSDIERTQALRVYLTEICSDQIDLAILMPPGSAGSEAQIRIHVVFPPDAPRRELLRPLDCDRSEYVMLPDKAALGPLLWSYLTVLDEASVVASQTTAVEVFRQPVEYYYEHVPQFLEQLTGGQLTSTSLSSALYSEIMSWSHKDISAATVITGYLHQRARVQMFYAVRRMLCMQEIYVGTVRYLRSAISLARPVALGNESRPKGLSSLLQLQRQAGPQTSFIPAPDEAKYVGINACPTDGAMRDAVRNMIAKVENVWAKSPATNWITAHNLYTYYVVWFFGFVTGARPTANPVLRVSEINKSYLSGRLQDKGADKAKLVWITPDLLEQLKFNEAYIETTRLATCIDYPCWFLNVSEVPEPASEEICEPILHDVLRGFPTNIHRRWMFNALLDSGCPYVAEWAGHFLTGNRLVGRGATASPTVVGQTILKYVEPIISYLEFRPIQVRL
jgi:hypothetical protein